MIFLGPLIYYNTYFQIFILNVQTSKHISIHNKKFHQNGILMYAVSSQFSATFFSNPFWNVFFWSFFFIDKNDTCEKWNAFFIKRIFVWRNPPFHENSCDMFVVCLQHYQLMQKFQKYITVNPINLQVLEPATLPGFTNFLSFSLYF